MNAPRDQRTRLATSAVNQDTSAETAPTQPPRVLDVVVEDSLKVAVVDPRSATSAPRSDTLHETALRPVATVAVDTVVNNKADTEVDSVAQLVAVVDRPATPAAATDT